MTQKVHSDGRQHESSKVPLRVLYISHSHPPEDAPLAIGRAQSIKRVLNDPKSSFRWKAT